MNEEQRNLGQKAAELSVRSERLSGQGKHEQALATMLEAVVAWRELAGATGAFARELAGALTNLAGTYLAVDRLSEGVPHARESVDMYRILAGENPEHRAELAAALNNLSAFLGQDGDPKGARDLSEESIMIYSALAETDPQAYLPEVARARANLAFAYQDLGQPGQAVQAARSGVETLAGPLLQSDREAAMELAPLVDALVGLYFELCETAQIDPDEAFITPIDDLLEELAEEAQHDCDDDGGHDCGHDGEHLH